MRFCYVTEKAVPEETGRLLAESCVQRGIDFFEVESRTFDYLPGRRLGPGDMLYCGAVSAAAMNVSQFLYNSGVATFHAGPDDIYFSPTAPPLVLQRSGTPIPNTVYTSSDDRKLLQSLVEQIGGFPVVVKLLGRSSGVGVMLLESMPSLISIVGYALARGEHPLLCQFIPGAIHWRLIVLGEQVVANYRNRQRLGDFRTDGSNHPADFQTAVPAPVARAGIQAIRSHRIEFAGIDVLEDDQGAPYVLEANFPCYYPHAQLVAGVDISGMMVDHLTAKARQFLSEV